MKKLYRKSAVHPTPSVVSEHLLSSLPAAILTLTAALSLADREVLAYLISCSSAGGNRRSKQKSGGGDHQACFDCNCFRCYTSYWAKWDSSPNRQLIHEIIDAFEESLPKESGSEKSRRKGKTVKPSNISPPPKLDEPEASPAEEGTPFDDPNSAAAVDGGGDHVEDLEKGSVRRFVSFVGERMWSVWG